MEIKTVIAYYMAGGEMRYHVSTNSRKQIRLVKPPRLVIIVGGVR